MCSRGQKQSSAATACFKDSCASNKDVQKSGYAWGKCLIACPFTKLWYWEC